MKIKNAGILSKDFFLSYFNLVLASRTNDIEEAKTILFKNLFNNNEKELGKTSYDNFFNAYDEIKRNLFKEGL